VAEPVTDRPTGIADPPANSASRAATPPARAAMASPAVRRHTRLRPAFDVGEDVDTITAGSAGGASAARAALPVAPNGEARTEAHRGHPAAQAAYEWLSEPTAGRRVTSAPWAAPPAPIRVTIGRIEVRAVMPSAAEVPALPPAAEPAAPILSLDAYLAQRDGGRR
jgi:hypothetical protein